MILRDEMIDFKVDREKLQKGFAFNRVRVITAERFDVSDHEYLLNEKDGSYFVLSEGGSTSFFVKKEGEWIKLVEGEARIEWERITEKLIEEIVK